MRSFRGDSPVVTTGRRVLVVDDDSSLRSRLRRLLQSEGLEIATAKNGEDALDAVKRVKPDVVLLDVMMPGLDGFEVCRRLKGNAETRLVPVVLLTGLNKTKHRVRGIDAGADDFLTKPFERAELIARIRSLLKLKSYTDELEQAESVLFALARSIEGKDPYTEGHCERLAEYAGALGSFMGLPDEQVTALRRAGIVHDVGKVAVPDAILLKRGPLTAAEWAIIWEHPVVGEQICEGLKSFRLVLPIIRHHHERRDGTGYPDSLAGDQIPLTARVLQVVDVYDALTTDRPYRQAISPQSAIETLEAETQKGWRDPDVLAAFKDLVRHS